MLLLLLEPSNVLMGVSLHSGVVWVGGGCECYEGEDGVEWQGRSGAVSMQVT